MKPDIRDWKVRISQRHGLYEVHSPEGQLFMVFRALSAALAFCLIDLELEARDIKLDVKYEDVVA